MCSVCVLYARMGRCVISVYCMLGWAGVFCLCTVRWDGQVCYVCVQYARMDRCVMSVYSTLGWTCVFCLCTVR